MHESPPTFYTLSRAFFFCSTAQNGLLGISITDHFECNYCEELGCADNLLGSRADTAKARSEFEGRLVVSQGIELVTIGSDAHYAAHVGHGIELGMDMLKEAGFSYVAFFRRRQPVLLKLI